MATEQREWTWRMTAAMILIGGFAVTGFSLTAAALIHLAERAL